MNCSHSSQCAWLTRFGERVCSRMFRLCRCKPTEEGGDSDGEMESSEGQGTTESTGTETA